jgi:hypothetical protein
MLAPALLGQKHISGQWCTETAPIDCVELTQAVTAGEVISASRQTIATTPYATASGYFHGGVVVLSYLRRMTGEIGYMTLTILNASYADGKIFNADGSIRWAGRFRRKTVSVTADIKTEVPPPVQVAASPAPASGATTAKGRPIGCFADKDQRDLGGAQSFANDAGACVAYCAAKGFKYAAKQAGTQCFCGNSYGRYGSSTACVSCRGLTAGDCGGSYANFVWEVTK